MSFTYNGKDYKSKSAVARELLKTRKFYKSEIAEELEITVQTVHAIDVAEKAKNIKAYLARKEAEAKGETAPVSAEAIVEVAEVAEEVAEVAESETTES